MIVLRINGKRPLHHPNHRDRYKIDTELSRKLLELIILLINSSVAFIFF